MQAIARVNRVFKDKPGGLIVDYIGIAQNLKNALGDYSDRDKKETGINQAKAVAVMLRNMKSLKICSSVLIMSAGLKGEAKGSFICNGRCNGMDIGSTAKSLKKKLI
jgi:type I restriction enzyme R subunit